jgi:hypothetical protein
MRGDWTLDYARTETKTAGGQHVRIYHAVARVDGLKRLVRLRPIKSNATPGLVAKMFYAVLKKYHDQDKINDFLLFFHFSSNKRKLSYARYWRNSQGKIYASGEHFIKAFKRHHTKILNAFLLGRSNDQIQNEVNYFARNGVYQLGTRF